MSFCKVPLPVHLKTETHYLPENLKERRSRCVVRCENTSVLASNDGLEECGSPCSQSGPSLTPQPRPWDTQSESGLQSSPVECRRWLTAPITLPAQHGNPSFTGSGQWTSAGQPYLLPSVASGEGMTEVTVMDQQERRE